MPTKIEWVTNPDGTKGETWNCVVGCTPTSEGCAFCYARRMTKRLQAMGQKKYAAGFDRVVCHEDMLNIPLRWKKPRRIFVNSMSDTFHEEVPLAFLREMFSTMNLANWHTFQVLTKRSERMLELSWRLEMTPNIWMGVSVEGENYLYRIDGLRDTQAAIKFLSFEPLLGPIDNLNLDGIDWAIVGCESGPGARPMQEDWVRSIRDQCVGQNVAFFYKQRMENGKKISCPELDRRVWKQFPV